jgi:hypothetical protein
MLFPNALKEKTQQAARGRKSLIRIYSDRCCHTTTRLSMEDFNCMIARLPKASRVVRLRIEQIVGQISA